MRMRAHGRMVGLGTGGAWVSVSQAVVSRERQLTYDVERSSKTQEAEYIRGTLDTNKLSADHATDADGQLAKRGRPSNADTEVGCIRSTSSAVQLISVGRRSRRYPP